MPVERGAGARAGRAARRAASAPPGANARGTGRMRAAMLTLRRGATHASWQEGEDQFKFWKEMYEEHDDLTYVTGQLERAESGYIHWQVYAEFGRQLSLQAVKELVGDATVHVEPRRGSQKQAIDYVTKEDTRIAGPFEYGEKKNQGRRSDLDTVADEIKNGQSIRDVATNHPTTFIRYGSGIQRWASIIAPSRTTKTHVTCIWGTPGAGKTYEARRLATEAAGGDESKVWWMGTTPGFFENYMGQEIAVLDDIDSGTPAQNGMVLPLDALLKAMDATPWTCNIKGSSASWLVKKLFITSNSRPEEWFGPAITLEKSAAIMRRIDVTRHMEGAYAVAPPPEVPALVLPVMPQEDVDDVLLEWPSPIPLERHDAIGALLDLAGSPGSSVGEPGFEVPPMGHLLDNLDPIFESP